ncbi:MAG: type II toxin-antitoxin system VapC family toxin [Haloarculaceae archaeon]
MADLSADVAAEAANLCARLETTDTSLDLADLLIAATAREHGATLATANENEFDKGPIHDLMDVDIVTN